MAARLRTSQGLLTFTAMMSLLMTRLVAGSAAETDNGHAAAPAGVRPADYAANSSSSLLNLLAEPAPPVEPTKPFTTGLGDNPWVSMPNGGFFILPEKMNEKWIKLYRDLEERTGVKAAGKRMEMESTWLNYAFGMPWTHLMWKYQMPLLNVMTPLMDAGPTLTDINYKYYDFVDMVGAATFFHPQEGGGLQVDLAPTSMIIHGPAALQMRFHTRALFAMLRSHFDDEGESTGFGQQCLDLVGTNSGIMYPNGGGPYTEFMCATPMKCSACLRLMYTAGMGFSFGAQTWGMWGGCMKERLALAIMIVRAWYCVTQATSGLGPYAAALGQMGNLALSTPAKTCYDLQQAAFAHNLHEDSSHLFNSYGIGMHCLVTLDLLFPYKGQLLNTAVRKVLQMNPKDSDPKELSVAQGTATVALWIFDQLVPKKEAVEGFLCYAQDFNYLAQRFEWMSHFPNSGCRRNFNVARDMHSKAMHAMKSSPRLASGLYLLVKETEEAAMAIDPKYGRLFKELRQKHKQLLRSDAATDIMFKVHQNKIREWWLELQLLLEQLEIPEKAEMAISASDVGKSVRKLQLDLLRHATDTEVLDSKDKIAMVMAWVVRPLAVNFVMDMMGSYATDIALDFKQTPFDDEGIFEDIPKMKELTRITDVLTYAFEEITWLPNSDVKKIGNKIHEANKLYKEVVVELGHPTMAASSPFMPLEELWSPETGWLQELAQEHQSYMKHQSKDYLRVFKAASDTRGQYGTLSHKGLEEFFRLKTADVQVNYRMRQYEEKYSNYIIRRGIRSKIVTPSVDLHINPLGEWEENSEIMKSAVPEFDLHHTIIF